jgi:undecaprenyl-diphosphatase
MTLFHLILVALVQGITEFLPISSSGHLILAPMVTGEPDQGPMIDMAVHVGTLFAVILAFRREVAEAFFGFFHLLRGHTDRWDARLALFLIVGTIPVVIVGAIFNAFGIMDWLRDGSRALAVIGWTTLIFGILLYIADKFTAQQREMQQITLKDTVMIGLAQAVALIPGTSRSGITMTAGRFLGLDRVSAARFSMLLAIPTIIAAGVLGTKDIVESGDTQLGIDALIAAGLSFIAALIAIKLFMRWIASASMTPFVVYRLILGSVLLWLAYV